MRWWLLAVLGACGHSPPPRAPACAKNFVTLSQRSPSAAPELARKPFSWITAVRVSGVEPVLARTLQQGLATEVGMMISDAPLRDDLRRIFKSGVVADVHVEVVGEGEIEFVVEPRAKIARVIMRGGDPQMARRFKLLEGAAYEPARVHRMAEAAQVAYVRAGWLEATVEAKRAVDGDRVSVCVAANPGPKLMIEKVVFPGHAQVPEASLLAAMKSKVNKVGGAFDAGGFELDKLYLQAEYWDRGHADVRVGEPRAVRKGKGLVVEIPIHEGPVFRFGKIAASVPVALTPGDVFGRTKVRSVVEELKRRPEIEDAVPLTKLDHEHRTIDITFEIRWRWPWFALWHWRSR